MNPKLYYIMEFTLKVEWEQFVFLVIRDLPSVWAELLLLLFDKTAFSLDDVLLFS